MLNDLLEGPQTINREGNSDLLDRYNTEIKLLKQIYREVARPSIQLKCELRFLGSTPLLVTGRDFCEVRFTYQSKPVKSQYLIVANASDVSMALSLNEPSMRGVSAADANGIVLGAQDFIQITAEIEYIQVGPRTNNVGQTIQVNNSNGSVPSQGTITIYAYGAPQQDTWETK